MDSTVNRGGQGAEPRPPPLLLPVTPPLVYGGHTACMRKQFSVLCWGEGWGRREEEEEREKGGREGRKGKGKGEKRRGGRQRE